MGGHNESTCPLLHPTSGNTAHAESHSNTRKRTLIVLLAILFANSFTCCCGCACCFVCDGDSAALKETGASATATILSSQDASLMEGLVDDEIVRKSFLVSLSSDLLKQTESDRSHFAAAQALRVNLLSTMHAALSRSRLLSRQPKDCPNPDEGNQVTFIKTLSSADDTGSNNSGSKGAASTSSLLLQMCVEMLRSSMSVSADSAICLRILDTLSLVLSGPAPLSLRNNPETAEWAGSVVAFLISVASAPATATDPKQIAAMQKRAVMLLLHLILQMGSLLTALQTVKLLGLTPPSLNGEYISPVLSSSEYHAYFKQFVSLQPSIGLNACLNRTNNFFLGEWDYKFPNDGGAAALAAEARAAVAKPKAAGRGGHGRGEYGRARRGRTGRHHGRRGGRGGGRRQMDNGADEEEEEGQAAAYEVAIATSGSFLFLHSIHYGLVKIGTGYAHTRRGHTYAHAPEFGRDDVGAIAYVAPFLYYRSERTGSNLLKLSAETLEVVEEINLAKKSGLLHISPDSPLVACHRFLYIIAVRPQPTGGQPAAAAITAEEQQSLSLHAETSKQTTAAATVVAPRKKHPDFECCTVDPKDGFKVIHRVLLHNPALEDPDAEIKAAADAAAAAATGADGSSSSSSTAVTTTAALPKRTPETCTACHRFHTLGAFYISTTYNAWCSACQARGYKDGKNVRLHNADVAAQKEFPSWYSPSISGQAPTARFGHTAALVRGPKIVAKTEEADEEDEEKKASGDDEEKKSSSSSDESVASTELTNNCWIFGGASGRALQYNGAANTIDMVFNDMHVFDADSNTWHAKLEVSGEKPSPRMGHSCTVVGSKLYILFGGKNDSGEECTSDVYIFDTETRAWSKPLVSGAAPEARQFHAAVLMGDELLIHGGRGSHKVLTDLCALNVVTHVWSAIKSSGVPAPNRYGHMLEVRDDPLAIGTN